MADALAKAETAVLEANAVDVARAEEAGTSAAIVDRLRLTADRVAGMVDGLRDVAGLPDPVGDVVRGWTNANGVQVRQVRVPFGVVGIVYEARPNVTADAAGLCLKSGNAVLLRGSSSAADSNAAVVEALRHGLARHRPAAGRRPARARASRGDGRADGCPWPGRRADPARRRRPHRPRRPEQRRPRHRDRGRQLPPLRRRERRPGHGPRDPAQRQDPAPLGLQRGRDAARPRRRGTALPTRCSRRTGRGRRDRPRRRAHRRVRVGRGGGEPRRTGRPSTSRSTSPRASSTRSTRPSPTSPPTRPGTARPS